jgi:putative phosphoesterase
VKILVLSDSHSTLSFMRLCIQKINPNAVVHLGDHFDDGAAMAEEFPALRFYQVPGNCDRYRSPMGAPETLVEKVCGVRLFMTHGHLHGVKQSLFRLVKDAHATGVQAVLFGHTHQAYCEREGELWVVNPGSCGYFGGSAALMEVKDGKISDCRILRQSDLDDLT